MIYNSAFAIHTKLTNVRLRILRADLIEDEFKTVQSDSVVDMQSTYSYAEVMEIMNLVSSRFSTQGQETSDFLNTHQASSLSSRRLFLGQSGEFVRDLYETKN